MIYTVINANRVDLDTMRITIEAVNPPMPTLTGMSEDSGEYEFDFSGALTGPQEATLSGIIDNEPPI